MDNPDQPDLDNTIRLVRSAQGGDEGAMNRLFTRYLPLVQQIVALRMGWRLSQMVDVEDIVQNALIRVFTSLERFEVRSEGSFRNWLARCVERELIDTHRAETREKRGGGAVHRFGDCNASVLHSSIFRDDGDSPSAYARVEELADRLENALLAMPEHERELIVLRALCDMPYPEIASQLGLTNQAAVRVACSRALRKLKAQVE
jgi:RNA polymerase sigma-70 factor (ECF subfamily)